MPDFFVVWRQSQSRSHPWHICWSRISSPSSRGLWRSRRRTLCRGSCPITILYFQCQYEVAHLEWQFDRFSTAVGCSKATDQLPCLRVADLRWLFPASVVSKFPGQETIPLAYFSPTIDGDLIPNYPYNLSKGGNFIHVPLIVGDETDRGSNFAHNASTAAEITTSYKSNGPRLTATEISEIPSLYPRFAPSPNTHLSSPLPHRPSQMQYSPARAYSSWNPLPDPTSRHGITASTSRAKTLSPPA